MNDEKAYWDSLNYASSLPAYKTVLRLLHSNNFAAIVRLSRWFLQYDFPSFLRCIVPDLVADVNLLFTFFKRKAQQNLLLFCVQIFSKNSANIIHQITHILSKDLQIPRSTQLHLIADAFLHDAQVSDLQKVDRLFSFMQIKDSL